MDTKIDNSVDSGKDNSFAMTSNQKKLSSSDPVEMFKKYKKLVCGNSSYLYWFFYEIYLLLIQPLPSIIGFGLRAFFLKLLLRDCKGLPMVSSSVTIRNPNQISFGKNVAIDRNVTLDVREGLSGHAVGIELGNNTFIGNGSMILAKGGPIIFGSAVNVSSACRIASEGKIEVGDSCLISAYCYIGPGNHKFGDKDVPIMEQGMEHGKGVKIGKNVWVGARVTILDGVTIGDNAIIGAHSFVREDVPSDTVVAGVPAKIIKKRDK